MICRSDMQKVHEKSLKKERTSKLLIEQKNSEVDKSVYFYDSHLLIKKKRARERFG